MKATAKDFYGILEDGDVKEARRRLRKIRKKISDDFNERENFFDKAKGT